MKKLFFAFAMMLSMTAAAQEEKDTTIVVPQDFKTVGLAAELSKYGYANKDAMSLIQAARLSKQAGLTEIERAKYEISEMRPAPEGEKSGGKLSLNVDELLADATAMAGEDGVLLALIDDVKNNVRGAVGGRKYAKDIVAAKGTDTYRIQFRANELAIVAVVGDGDTDLDLYIYDENGNLITKDDDYTDYCYVTFTPRWTGYFTIKIVNRGSVYNRYAISTN